METNAKSPDSTSIPVTAAPPTELPETRGAALGGGKKSEDCADDNSGGGGTCEKGDKAGDDEFIP